MTEKLLTEELARVEAEYRFLTTEITQLTGGAATAPSPTYVGWLSERAQRAEARIAALQSSVAQEQAKKTR